MSVIILPGDPDFDKPIVMGDPYANALTPKLAAQRRVEEADKNMANGLTHYAASQLAYAPEGWVKTAQAGGMTGTQNMQTNPMWFSPLHTPMSWQTPSKRREGSQWSFIKSKEIPCLLTKYGDFSLVDIEDVYTFIASATAQTEPFYIQNAKGEKAPIDMASCRHVNKKANKIKVMSVPEPIVVTWDHKCIAIKRDDIKCSKHLSKYKNCIHGLNSPTCKRINCQIYNTIDYRVSTLDAQDVEVGDYFLIPFPTEVRESIITNIDQARFAGHLAADGWVSQINGVAGQCETSIAMNKDEVDYVYPTIAAVHTSFGAPSRIETTEHSSMLLEVRTGNGSLHRTFSSKVVKGKGISKRFTEEVMLLKPELQLEVLGAYIQSDGSYNKTTNNVEITTVSPHLANQLLIMFYRCGIMPFCNKQPISSSPKTFKTNNPFRYMVVVPASYVTRLKQYVPGKLKNHTVEKTTRHNRFFWKNYVVSPVVENESFDYDGDVYDVRAPDDFTITANGVGIHQCRFFLENDPKVAAGITFYSQFSMSGYSFECPSRAIRNFFKHKVDRRLKLNENFKMISSEYFTLGDVFVHKDIECSSCGGTGKDPETGEVCNHAGGDISKLVILNPDWIEVQQSPFGGDPNILMIPDDQLKKIVFMRQPLNIYNSLPDQLKKLVLQNKPIPLSNRTVSHLKHMPVPYGTYGTSLIRRLFMTLAYKTKLMTANWIVAERLIIPIRIVKVGSDARPASSADIADMQTQLAAVANDPNVTIVCHHALEYDFVGASGKILQVTQEMEFVGKEILDGLMLNQSLLNGEMCLTDDTEVLTATGYKTIHQITQADLLCEFDAQRKTYTFRQPQELIKYDDVESVFEVLSGEKVLFKCTGAHKILCVSKSDEYWTPTAQELFDGQVETRTLLRDGTPIVVTGLKKTAYGRSVFCFKTHTGFFVAKYQNTEFISANSGYSSAQVGVETLIRRIDAWRQSLAEWAEEEIFLPIAEMQGFIDKEMSKELGERVYLYPRIKWNDLNLKDKTPWYQILLSLHDKQVLSTQTLMEELGLNYDQEVKRMRYEQTVMTPQGGMMPGGGGAGGAGGMGMGGMGGGGGGGMPGGDMAGGMPGAGMPGAGGMGGGAGPGVGGAMTPGGDMGAGGGMPGATAGGGAGFKVMKANKTKKQDQPEPMPAQMMRLTRIEKEMAHILDDVLTVRGINKNAARFQFPIPNPHGGKPYAIDWALPHIKLGLEADASISHDSEEQKAHDKERDYLLAQRGWTVLRFHDKEIEDAPQAIKQQIDQYIVQLSQKKTASVGEPEDVNLGVGLDQIETAFYERLQQSREQA